MQSYFTTRSQVDYFIVIKEEATKEPRGVEVDPVLLQPEKDLFIKLEKDYKVTKVDIKEQASIVYNIRASRSERVPWLHNLTRFLYYMSILKDKEIWSSYKLLPKRELETGSKDAKDPYLV